MKSVIKLLTLACAAALVSCSKEYQPTIDLGPNTLRGFMTADLGNGDQFVSHERFAKKTYIEDQGITTLQIGATEHSYNKNPKVFRSISLNVGVYEGPKTYSLEYGNGGVLVKQYEHETQTFMNKQFEPDSHITIDSDSDGKITGSFYFIATRQANNQTEEIYVSEGKFEAHE